MIMKSTAVKDTGLMQFKTSLGIYLLGLYQLKSYFYLSLLVFVANCNTYTRAQVLQEALAVRQHPSIAYLVHAKSWVRQEKSLEGSYEEEKMAWTCQGVYMEVLINMYMSEDYNLVQTYQFDNILKATISDSQQQYKASIIEDLQVQWIINILFVFCDNLTCQKMFFNVSVLAFIYNQVHLTFYSLTLLYYFNLKSNFIFNINPSLILIMIKKPSKQDVKLATQYINELQDADINKRISAAQNLAFIAKTLTNDRVIRQLIPFLRQQILNDQTPVIIQVLNEVFKLAKILGGGVTATHLFPLVEDLLQSEEQKIRKKAVSEYYQLVQICQIKKSQNQIVTSLKRVWNFQYIQARQAFAMVVAKELGNFCPPNQNDFLAIYQQMAESESVVLRKFAAMYSSDLVNWIRVSEVTIMKIVEVLFKDKEEANKIFLVDTIIELAKIKPPTALQPYFNLISYQFSWRVRYELIAKIGLLAQAMGKESFKTFLSYIIKYINDIEPEIRSISCLKLEELTKYVDVQDIVGRIIPALRNLTQDQHLYVKHSLAASILHLCKVIGKKNTTDLILPKFLTLLKDDDEQVRMTIFKNVGLICDVLGVQTLSQTTMPALNELATHTNWRIRAESIGLYFYFISRSPKEFMDDKNIKLAIDYIRDRAFSVRKEGMKLLVNLAKLHDGAWFQKNIMPKLLNIFKATGYLQRETILLTMEHLMPALSPEYVFKYIYPGVKDLAGDEVENVRLSAILTLKETIDVLPKEKQTIKKMIKKLSVEDSDKDVRELAEKTLKEIE